MIQLKKTSVPGKVLLKISDFMYPVHDLNGYAPCVLKRIRSVYLLYRTFPELSLTRCKAVNTKLLKRRFIPIFFRMFLNFYEIYLIHKYYYVNLVRVFPGSGNTRVKKNNINTS